MNTPKRQTKSRADIEAEHDRILCKLDETCRSWTEYEAAVEREEARFAFAMMDIEDEDWRDYDEDIPY